jgi:hypothetical protein
MHHKSIFSSIKKSQTWSGGLKQNMDMYKKLTNTNALEKA